MNQLTDKQRAGIFAGACILGGLLLMSTLTPSVASTNYGPDVMMNPVAGGSGSSWQAPVVGSEPTNYGPNDWWQGGGNDGGCNGPWCPQN